MSISTKRGDDGTTGLLFGGRVRKNSLRIEVNGAVDEAQAVLGMARAEARAATGPSRPRASSRGAISDGKSSTEMPEVLDSELVGLERALWVLMAEVATAPRNRPKLVNGSTKVSLEMLGDVESKVHELEASIEMPSEFVVPGESKVSAALDLARTAVRRAERLAVGLDLGEDSQVVAYLNRLSDLCWLLARAAEVHHVPARAGNGARSARRA